MSEKPTDTNPTVKQAVKAALVERDVHDLYEKLDDVFDYVKSIDERLKALEAANSYAKGWLGGGRFVAGIVGGAIVALIELIARK